MPELTYHKRIKRQHNVLSEKGRYLRKRMRRGLGQILYLHQNRIDMQLDSTGNNDEGMEVEILNEGTIIVDGETATISSIPEVQVTKPTKLNWFEKAIMFFRKLFSKK